MTVKKRIVVLLLIYTGLLLPWQLAAQQHLQVYDAINHPVLMAIDKAERQGSITPAEAILQKVYAGFKPERVRQQFLNRAEQEHFIRCMTPVMQEFEQKRDLLPPDVVHEIEDLTIPQINQNTQSHLSTSGNFILHYDLDGTHAVPADDESGSGVPDYVERAAFAADSSYRYQVEQIGFEDFLRDQPYEIFFRNFQFYGTTNSSGSTTTISVHRNFNNFPPNTHPGGNQTGALYATIAHEIKHAVQYATNRWEGQAGSQDWSEMDATLMEEAVFPDVNDYYNYIMSYNSQAGDWNRNSPHQNSIFGRPHNATPGAYWHVSWMLYFYEQYGGEFWADVWREFIPDRQKPFIEAIENVLVPRGLSFGREHITNHLWHLASGPANSRPGFGFEDRMNYPNASIRNTVHLMPDMPTHIEDSNLSSLGAHYYEVMPTNVALGQPSFSLTSFRIEGPGASRVAVDSVGFGVLGYFRDGSTDVQIAIAENSNQQFLQTTWDWRDLVDMKLVVVNMNSKMSSNYELEIFSTIPDEDTITQNYPNPFNPTTQIEFSLTETKDVKIEVYDSIGRKVATLADGRFNQGFHTVTFDGSGLASGVYLYRILTDQAQVTRKMVLVR